MSGAELERLAPQFVRQSVQPDLDTMANSMAQMALSQVRAENPDLFRRYGPDINLKLASIVDKRVWTVDNLRTVVNLVKADHVEEIASEIASRRFSEQEAALRSTGAALPSVAPRSHTASVLQNEAISADWRKRAADVGISESDVADFCRGNNMTPEQFVAQFASKVITEGSRAVTEISIKRSP